MSPEHENDVVNCLNVGAYNEYGPEDLTVTDQCQHDTYSATASNQVLGSIPQSGPSVLSTPNVGTHLTKIEMVPSARDEEQNKRRGAFSSCAKDLPS